MPSWCALPTAFVSFVLAAACGKDTRPAADRSDPPRSAAAAAVEREADVAGSGASDDGDGGRAVPGPEAPVPDASEVAREDDVPPVPVHAPCGEVPSDMVCVPGGAFWRGADDGDADEKPRARVVVATFHVDRNEVTNRDFDRCVAVGACRRPMPYHDFRRHDQPVVAVDWHNAAAYCAWKGRRLPTEAEWEKAARGEDGRVYPWGNEPPSCERAAHQGCPPESTRTVGSFEAGAYGIFDMAGNSYEWVADWYSPCYAGCEGECGGDCAGPDPQGPCAGAAECPGRTLRVLRGGSWYWEAERMRGSDRRPMRPDSGSHRLGFRCAASPADPRASAAHHDERHLESPRDPERVGHVRRHHDDSASPIVRSPTL